MFRCCRRAGSAHGLFVTLEIRDVGQRQGRLALNAARPRICENGKLHARSSHDWLRTAHVRQMLSAGVNAPAPCINRSDAELIKAIRQLMAVNFQVFGGRRTSPFPGFSD